MFLVYTNYPNCILIIIFVKLDNRKIMILQFINLSRWTIFLRKFAFLDNYICLIIRRNLCLIMVMKTSRGWLNFRKWGIIWRAQPRPQGHYHARLTTKHFEFEYHEGQETPKESVVRMMWAMKQKFDSSSCKYGMSWRYTQKLLGLTHYSNNHNTRTTNC